MNWVSMNADEVRYYVNIILMVISVAAFTYIVFFAKYDDK